MTTTLTRSVRRLRIAVDYAVMRSDARERYPLFTDRAHGAARDARTACGFGAHETRQVGELFNVGDNK